MSYYVWTMLFCCLGLLFLPSIIDFAEYWWVNRNKVKKTKYTKKILDQNFSQIFKKGVLYDTKRV